MNLFESQRGVRGWYACVIFFAAAATAICGIPGFYKQTSGSDLSLVLYKTCQLFLLNSGAEGSSNGALVAARVFASITFLLWSGGLIWLVVKNARLWVRSLSWKGHTVICGLGEIGRQLLSDIISREPKGAVVVIEDNEGSPWLDYARGMGAEVIEGDATQAVVLKEANAAAAGKIYAVTGDDEDNHAVATQAVKLLDKRSFRLPRSRSQPPVFPAIYAHFTQHTTQIDARVQGFNVVRNAATRLITEQLWPFAPTNAGEPGEVGHFVIVGFQAKGQTMAVQLARLAHFPNRKRSRITIIDPAINRLAAQFLTTQYGRFTAWGDGNFGVNALSPETDRWDAPQQPTGFGEAAEEPNGIQYVVNAQFKELSTDTVDGEVVNKIIKLFAEPGVKPCVIICEENEVDNAAIAKEWRRRLDQDNRVDVPVFAWLPELSGSFATAENYQPFGAYGLSASVEAIEKPKVEFFARVFHEYFEKNKLRKEMKKGEQGQISPIEPFSKLETWMQESNRQAAEHLPIKLATLGYEIRTYGEPFDKWPEEFSTISGRAARLLAEMEHNRWMGERLMSGWEYAQETNREAMKHSNLTPFKYLPPSSKELNLEQIRAALFEAQRNSYFLVKKSG